MIYRPLNGNESEDVTEELLQKVEKALGFKLFFWQKYFIATGMWRRYGKTTAEILRELLMQDASPINFTKPCRNPIEDFYRKELLEIKEKLDAEGIQTRKVARTEKELREYMENSLKGGKRNGRIQHHGHFE